MSCAGRGKLEGLDLRWRKPEHLGQDSGAISQTKRLIKLVRTDVRAHLGANLLPELGLEPETGALSFVGHRGVTLTLANGTITWEEPRGVTARTRQRTGSGTVY